MRFRGRIFVFLLLCLAVFARAQNVVLITIDTLRADHVHCFGYPLHTSPELDRLAGDSVRFTRAYTPIPVTLPSHAAILTGTLPPVNGVEDFNSRFTRTDISTLAELLKRSGYATAAIVAAPVLDHRYGLNRGFDFYYDDFDFSRLDEINYDLLEHKANVVVDQALEWLRAQANQKFFLWLHVYDPHYPYIPPQPFASRFSSAYDGEIAFADHELGRLFTYLRRAGIYSDSIIAVTGDHGESLGEHGEAMHGFFIYDATLRVPMLVKLPQLRFANTEAAAPVQTIDLFPTILQLVHQDVPGNSQGRSLLPLISHQESGVSERRLFAETELPKLHFSWSDLRSLRAGRYKYILAPRPELYDLVNDPGETHNLAGSRQAIANQLRSDLLAWDARLRPEKTPASKTAIDERDAEALRSLGYIAGPSSSMAAQVDSLQLPDPKDRLHVYKVVTSATQLAQRGLLDDAAAKLRSASKLDSENPTIHYLIGLYLLRGTRSTPSLLEAADHFRAALAAAPNDIPSSYGLALTYLHLGEIDAAISGFRHVLSLDPLHFHATFNLGVALLRKSDLAGAERAFSRAIELEPASAEAWNALGQLYLFEGRRAEAQTAADKALSADPNYAPARQILARLQASSASVQH